LPDEGDANYCAPVSGKETRALDAENFPVDRDEPLFVLGKGSAGIVYFVATACSKSLSPSSVCVHGLRRD